MNANKYYQRRYHDEVEFRLLAVLRARLGGLVKRKDRDDSTCDLLGCSVEFLRQHLESQFVDGMSWDNYGRDGWHIDHKIPCSAFDLSDPEQQKKCFNWSNLQPLWGTENVSKGDKFLDQDEGWQSLGEEFDQASVALRRAAKLCKDAICVGMTRVVDSELRTVLRTFPAGG